MTDQAPSSSAASGAGDHHQQRRREISGALTNYPGSKSGSGVTQWLINHMPPHDCYIEAFVGSGAVLLVKRPARSSIIIDSDAEVIRSWRQAPWTTAPRPDHCYAPALRIFEGDAISILPTLAEFHQPTTLVYCDPPYLLSTRRSQRHLYKHEMVSELEHLRLLEILVTAKCNVMLSGYRNKLYPMTLRGWPTAEFHTVTHRGQPATEVIWMNYEMTGALHDYRFVGEGFRERERIKKKINRWVRMLRAMPPAERHAIIERVTELRPHSPSTARSDVDPNHATHRLAHSKQTPHRSSERDDFSLIKRNDACSLTATGVSRSPASSQTARRSLIAAPVDAAGDKRNHERRVTPQPLAPNKRSLKRKTK